MTQEDKELLLNDLSARLFYKVIVRVTYKNEEGWKTEDRKVLGINTYGQVYVDRVYTDIENIKPYLRSMSSMTEEEVDEYNELCTCNVPFPGIVEESVANFMDWLNSHHFDYRGLIEKGLALEAPEGIYN